MILQQFPIAPMLIVLLIPLFYSMIKEKTHLKKITILFVLSILIVLLYPLVTYLNDALPNSTGYFVGKLILFTFLPLITVIYLERWNIKNALKELGIHTNKLLLSIILGLGALAVTLSISLIFFTYTTTTPQILTPIILFFEAFNEEFYFRAILLLYLWRLTNIKIAYTTATLAFILAHPQYLTPTVMIWNLLTTTLQGVLLGLVTYKTKNIIGPWISHGLNRALFMIIQLVL